MNTYPELEKYLAAARKDENIRRDKDLRNTYIERVSDSCIAVRLHATRIAEFHSDNRIVLFARGYQTVTTKDRMNHFLPKNFAIWQKNNQWFIGESWDASKSTPFFDGITLVPNGKGHKILNPQKDSEVQDNKKLLKKIKAFVKGYLDDFFAGKVPAPSGGDCWNCYMQDERSGKTLGELSQDKDHLLGHFREKYYVPSLLTRAIELFPVSRAAESSLYCAWSPEATEEQKTTQSKYMNEIAHRQLSRSLQEYLKQQLGLPSSGGKFSS